jgi:FkbM family methyltransferase
VSTSLKWLAREVLPPVLVKAVNRLRERVWRFNETGSRHLASADPENVGNGRKYWGLHDLDRQIEKYLNFEGGFYVELGANDGKLASNTFYYERSRHWRGILIEPAPNLYIACRQNRSTKNYFECAACVSFDYQGEFVKIVYSDSMSVSLNVESDIGDGMAHAELGRQFLKPGETVFTFGAIAKTLNSILIEGGAPKLIDFLSLDVEGAELEVLKGIDHEEFKFRYMLIECRDIQRLQDYLGPLNYRMVDEFNEHDYLFEQAISS